MAFIDTSSSVKSGEVSTHLDYVLQAFRDTLADSNIKVDYKIITLSVLGCDGEGTISDLILAIEDAEKRNAQICNLSLSTYKDCPELKEVIETSNMVFIAAAGNEGENLDEGFPSYPVNYRLDNVISVAALDDTGKMLKISNYGENTVNVAVNGILKYKDEVIEGTSIATARVTALASIICSVSDVRLSSGECKKRIEAWVKNNENSLQRLFANKNKML